MECELLPRKIKPTPAQYNIASFVCPLATSSGQIICLVEMSQLRTVKSDRRRLVNTRRRWPKGDTRYMSSKDEEEAKGEVWSRAHLSLSNDAQNGWTRDRTRHDKRGKPKRSCEKRKKKKTKKKKRKSRSDPNLLLLVSYGASRLATCWLFGGKSRWSIANKMRVSASSRLQFGGDI